MARLAKITDKRSGRLRYRLRYGIHFPDGSSVERSRRYGTVAIARAKIELATVLESRTRQLLQEPGDLVVWRHEGLISREEAERLSLAPPAAKKTLEQALDEYRATWEVGPEEDYTRGLRLRIIKEILGAETPLADIGYAQGEALKAELRKRGLKIATVRRYLQDLKRCLRRQVRLGVLTYNPCAELSGGRVPTAELPKQTKLNSVQIQAVLTRAEKRVQSETGWAVLGGWLDVALLLFFGTGLRRKEAMLARWEHIDWEARSLLVPADNAKDRNERRVGLGRRLYQALAARHKAQGAREDDGDFILPRYSMVRVTKAVTSHFAFCGIQMRLHDTRHTYTTLLQEEAGARPDQAMQRTGHNDLAMLSRYTHPEFGDVIEDRLGFMQQGNWTQIASDERRSKKVVTIRSHGEKTSIKSRR
jgi:integrase